MMRFSEIKVSGLSLPEMHERFLARALGDKTPTIINGDPWFAKYARGARDYYVDLFLGLQGKYVLFEDFVSDEKDAQFFVDIVQPAFRIAVERSGAPPQIMRLNPGRRVISPLWYAYPDHYRIHLAELGVNL